MFASCVRLYMCVCVCVCPSGKADDLVEIISSCVGLDNRQQLLKVLAQAQQPALDALATHKTVLTTLKTWLQVCQHVSRLVSAWNRSTLQYARDCFAELLTYLTRTRYHVGAVLLSKT